MSYTRLLYHIVFRTKYGEPTIVEEHEAMLYRYICGYVQEQDAVLYRINGMPDHLHLFVELKATTNVADFVKHLKNSTHLFLERHRKYFPDFYAWSKDYCALTYSQREKDKIINYIKNQKAHHQSQNFVDEIKFLLMDYGIEYNEVYFERNL
ncbi:IS200/IS605 family transposase [Pasteurella bettyae]|uniref:IS200/IS605 family transposase n=1 Tax=Pasteurella bettyae TaxID=752 RepID=UPI003D29C111